MQKKSIIMTLAMTSFFTLNLAYAKEPKNLATYKATLIKYHDSGAYQKDQAQIINQAMQYLKTRLAQEQKARHPNKLAIVLDIDETSLSNYQDMLAMNFGGTSQQICSAEEQANDAVIAPTLELYRYAKANNVAVFFVTGRTESYRSATEKNLLNAGYESWNGLTLKPETYHEKSAAIYKINARSEIEKQGYDIVLNIGDQQSDLVGGHADKTFKLPNPYYFIA
jgi:predicted secreted acid phosphatase